MTRRRQEPSLLLVLLGLVLIGAHGSESPATTADSPAPALPASEPSDATPTSAPSPDGVAAFSVDVRTTSSVLKECPVSDNAIRTSFNDDIDWQSGYYDGSRLEIAGPSVCSILGVEPFNGDKPFSTSFLGRPNRLENSTLQLSTLQGIVATFGDVLVKFADTADNSRSRTLSVYNISAANIGRDGRYLFDPIYIRNLTSDALAAKTAGSPAALPTAGRRRLAQLANASMPEPASTGDPCEEPRVFCRAAVAAVKSLGPLCPASEEDRRALASRIFQTCGAAYCRNPQPIEEGRCYEKNAICHMRLAQLLTCAAARRCERALESDDRVQLGCDRPRRDPFFSKGCSGVVYEVSTDESSVAKKFNITDEELRAANPGRDVARSGLICIPAKPAKCGELYSNRTQAANTLAFRIPVEGRVSATITRRSSTPTNLFSQERVTVRDQGSGLLLDSTRSVGDSNSSLKVKVPSGTREIAVVVNGPADYIGMWATGITCQ